MSVMVILLGASLVVGVIFLIAFIWSVKSGQFDDQYSPAHKLLFEDKEKKEQKTSENLDKSQKHI